VIRGRSESVGAIWLVCVGIGLLFMARGAFQPYAFPLFQHLGQFRYAQIALLVNGYVMAQSVCAPLAGWYADRTSVRFALATSILFGLVSFLLISIKPGFTVSVIAVFVAGLAFILGKIALNTILVLQSSAELLRRSVAKRATLLNLGSFCGNSIAYGMTTHVGYSAHAVLLGLLHLPLAIGLGAKQPPAKHQHKETWGVESVKSLCKNRGFLGDSLRRFALVLPYGCWGTIIPKYVINQFHSTENVCSVYRPRSCTTIIGAHFLAVHVSAMLYRRGFRWEWWSMVSVLLYCAGLLLLIFVKTPMMLPVAIIVFICGEVLMTPCFDETAKKHSGEKEMATCMGLLHLVDGAGRLIGSVFALGVYGWMRNSKYQGLYWPVVVAAFLVVCSVLHVIAFEIAGRGEDSESETRGVAALTPLSEVVELGEPQV